LSLQLFRSLTEVLPLLSKLGLDTREATQKNAKIVLAALEKLDTPALAKTQHTHKHRRLAPVKRSGEAEDVKEDASQALASLACKNPANQTAIDKWWFEASEDELLKEGKKKFGVFANQSSASPQKRKPEKDLPREMDKLSRTTQASH